VLRPTIFHSASRRAIGRNLALDLAAAIGIGVTMALVGILPTVARRAGLEPIGLAALAATPFVANLLGAFAGRLGPRNTVHLALTRGIGALSLTILFLVPPAPVIVAVAVVFWLSFSFGGPFHLRMWGAMYPARVRGRIVGFLGMGRAAAAAFAAFGGGILADHIGGERAVAVAGVVGVACAVCYSGLRAAPSERVVAFVPFSPRDSLRALRDSLVLRRIALAQGFYGGGLIAAGPLYALVYVDRLHLSLAQVGVIGILSAAATMIAFPVWGLVSDRHGPLTPLRIGSFVGLLSVIGYSLAPDVSVLWLCAVMSGIGGASIDVGIAANVSNETSLGARAAAMAGWNALTGARGIVAAFLMSACLQLGFVDVRLGLLLCAGVSLVGVVLFSRAGRMADAAARERRTAGTALEGRTAAVA
jgi:hypothetical protein